MLFIVQGETYALLSFKLENKRISDDLITSLTLFTKIIGEKKQHLTFSALYEDMHSTTFIKQIYHDLEQAIASKQQQIDLTDTLNEANSHGFKERTKNYKDYPQIHKVLDEPQPNTEQGTFVKFTEPTRSSSTKHYVFLAVKRFDIRPEVISANPDTYYTIRFLGNPDYIPAIEVTLNRYKDSYQRESSSIEYWYRNALRDQLNEALKTQECIDLEEVIIKRFPSKSTDNDIFNKSLSYRDFTTRLKESKSFVI